MKNNKKGFTLIELLAVIAILAILVVLAVPAILRIFNESKDSALVTQAQSIFKAAEEQIITDQMKNQGMPLTYCYLYTNESSSLKGNHTLELSGTTKVSYKIVVNNVTVDDKTVTGITKFMVTDGSKIIGKEASSGLLSVSDISLDDIANVDSSPSTTATTLDDFPANCN